MDTQFVREELYKIFPMLVIDCGLSVNEAMAYGLSQVIGLSRTQTAEMMSYLTRRDITPGAVSKYISLAKTKAFFSKDPITGAYIAYRYADGSVDPIFFDTEHNSV